MILNFWYLLSFRRLLISQSMKYTSLDNQPSLGRPTLINLHPSERSNYSFLLSLDRCGGSFNTFDDLLFKINQKM